MMKRLFALLLVLVISGCASPQNADDGGPGASIIQPSAQAGIQKTTAGTTAAPAATPSPATDTQPEIIFNEDGAIVSPAPASAPALICKGSPIEEGSQGANALLASLLGPDYAAAAGDGGAYASSDGSRTAFFMQDSFEAYAVCYFFDNNRPNKNLGAYEAVSAFAVAALASPGLSGMEHGAPVELSSYIYAVPRLYNGLAVYHQYRRQGLTVGFDGYVTDAEIYYLAIEPNGPQIDIMPYEQALELVKAALCANVYTQDEPDEDTADQPNEHDYTLISAEVVYDCVDESDGRGSDRLTPYWRIEYSAIGTYDFGMAEGVIMEIVTAAMVNCETGEVVLR